MLKTKIMFPLLLLCMSGCNPIVENQNREIDEALINNLNKALALYEAEQNKKPSTMFEAVEGLGVYGYNVMEINPKSNASLLYNLVNNRFVLEDNPDVKGNEREYWKIQDNIEDQTYNIFAGKSLSNRIINGLHTGFDAGYNQNISSITLSSTDYPSLEMLIRTNKGFLTIEARNSFVSHFGTIDNVTLSGTCFYKEYGNVNGLIYLLDGKITVQPESHVKKINTYMAEPGSQVIVDGYVEIVDADPSNPIIATGTGYVKHNGSENAEPMGSPQN